MSRHAVGDRGKLARPLRTTCCDAWAAVGTDVEIYRQHSPNRVFVKLWPPVPFFRAGHSFIPPDGDPETFVKMQQAMKQSGSLDELEEQAPRVCPVHKVRLSSIWFESDA